MKNEKEPIDIQGFEKLRTGIKHLELNIKYQIYESKEELVPEDCTLVKKAIEASFNAYAPYSNFRVGAAVLLSKQKIICGNNQENASYPEGLCAERVALFSAMSQYPNEKVIAIAIVGNPKKFKAEHFLSPCGACRQVLAECEQRGGSPIKVIMSAIDTEIAIVNGISNLLPFTFSANDLNK